MLFNSLVRRGAAVRTLLSNIFCSFRGENMSKPSLNQLRWLWKFGKCDQLLSEIGCATSMSAVVYSKNVFCDWDTCSSNPPSFVSTLEKPQRWDESAAGADLQQWASNLYWILSLFIVCNAYGVFVFRIGLFYSSTGLGSMPSDPWLLELRRPCGSTCLSGSDKHAFKPMTISVWFLSWHHMSSQLQSYVCWD